MGSSRGWTGGPVRIAHRGEPRGHRENTEPAIRAAVAAGADLVELDLRLTADGQPVLLHDETLERLWKDPRRVDALPFAELAAHHRRLDAAHRLPTLDEAIDWMLELDTGYVLDFTEPAVAVAAAEVVYGRGVADRVWFCGDTEGLAAIRDRQPGATIALTWSAERPPGPKIFGRVQPQYYNPRWQLLDAATVDATHAAGIGVCTWTVDSATDMTALLDLGVDAIISNEIARLVDVVARHEPRGRQRA